MAKTIQGFDTRLKEAMHLKGMKQVELSEKTGIGKSSISHYMSGTHSPTTDRVYLIAKALNVSEAWLLGYDVPMEREDIRNNTNSLEINHIVAFNEQRNMNVVEKIEDLIPKLDIRDFPRVESFLSYHKAIKQREYEIELDKDLNDEKNLLDSINHSMELEELERER